MPPACGCPPGQPFEFAIDFERFTNIETDQKRFGEESRSAKTPSLRLYLASKRNPANLVPQKTPSLRLPPQINEGPSEKCELPPRIFPALVTM
jgi:hypothetical protein